MSVSLSPGLKTAGASRAGLSSGSSPRPATPCHHASRLRPSPRHLTRSHAGRQGRGVDQPPRACRCPQSWSPSAFATSSAVDAVPSPQTRWRTASFFGDQSGPAPSWSPAPPARPRGPSARPAPAACGAPSPRPHSGAPRAQLNEEGRLRASVPGRLAEETARSLRDLSRRGGFGARATAGLHGALSRTAPSSPGAATPVPPSTAGPRRPHGLAREVGLEQAAPPPRGDCPGPF